MCRQSSLFSGLVATTIVALLTLLAVMASPALAGQAVGTFALVEGAVDVMRGGALPAVSVKAGDPVTVGDFVRTRSNSKAEIRFSDGNVVKIAQRSRVDISQYVSGVDGQRSLRLPRGKVQAVVTKAREGAGPGKRFEIQTPNAVAGVRGTNFFVYHERNVTGVVVKEGTVYTYNQSSPRTVVNVPAGTATTVTEKRAPQPPRPVSDTEMKHHDADLAKAKPETKEGAKKGEAAPAAAAGSTPPAAGTAEPVAATTETTAAAPQTNGTTAASTGGTATEPVTSTTSASAMTTLAADVTPPAAPVQPTTSPISQSIAPTVTTTTTTVTVPVTETAPQTLAGLSIAVVSGPPTSSNSTAASFVLSDSALTYTYSLDGGASQPFAGTISSLIDGTHTVTFTGQDAKGNTSQPVSYTWTVDTVAPVLTLAGAPKATSTVAVIPVSLTTSESGTTINYRVDAGVWQPFGGSVTPLPEGKHTIEFQAADQATNVSNIVSHPLFVGSRDLDLGGYLSGLPGGAATVGGKLFELGDKSSGAWSLGANGAGAPPAALSLAAGGRVSLNSAGGPLFDGFWLGSGSASATGGTISGSLSYTHLGVDRIRTGTTNLNGIYDAASWSVKGDGSFGSANSVPLGFVADLKLGPMYRLGTTSGTLLTIVNLGGMDGLLGGVQGLWSGASVPLTLAGVYGGPATQNSYWNGTIGSKNYVTGGVATYDGASFSGFIGGANLDPAATTAGNMAMMYVAPRGGGQFGAGLLSGSFNGTLGSGFWGGTGSLNRLELNTTIAVDPSTMAADWWSLNTFQTARTVVTGPLTVNQDRQNSADGFLADASLNLSGQFGNRGDVLQMTLFRPDPTFGVWQRESFGTYTGSGTSAILITDVSTGTLSGSKIIPDNISSVVSIGNWGATGDLTGKAYGYWGDFAAGSTRMMSGIVNGSYNAGTGAFGASSNGSWLSVDRFLALSAAGRQQIGFPGQLQATTFTLSGSNGMGSTVTLSNIRLFSHAAGDPLSLWATDTVSGSFSGGAFNPQDIPLYDGGSIRGSLRISNAGTSPVSGNSVWLAEINGLGEVSGTTFRSTFNGVAAGTYSGTSFTGTAAGITHPVTYFSNLNASNYLKRFNGGSAYQAGSTLYGVFGGMSLWSASPSMRSEFEMRGVVPTAPTAMDYILSSDLDSFDVNLGTPTTADGGAYRGFLTAGLSNAVIYPTEPLDGRINALYISPSGRAGILRGKFSGYVSQIGSWEGHGDWFQVEMASSVGGGITGSSLLPSNVASYSVPVNLALSGQFQGGGTIGSVASITGNNWDMARIGSVTDWGIWRLTSAGTFTGTTSDPWSYALGGINDSSRFLDGVIAGDRWSVSDRVLHGNVAAGWVDMSSAVPTTGILVGETLGTFDPVAFTWQAVSSGAWLETTKFLQMASTAAGQATLQQLNIPAYEIGSADLSGSFAGVDSVSVTMNNVKFFAPTAGGRPAIWATGNVSGTYSGVPVGVSIPMTQTGGTNTSSITGNLTMQTFSGNQWRANFAAPSGVVGGTNVQIFGGAAGSYTGAGSGTLSGTGAGAVR